MPCRPRLHPRSAATFIAYLAAAALAGCANSGPTSGDGGSAGSSVGGAPGSGGTAGSSGAPTAGAVSTSSGASGIDGQSGSVGVAGSGGSPASSGAPGTGGVAGSGGNQSGGMGGAGSSMGGASAGGAGGAGGAANSCPTATPLTGGKKYCSNTKGTVSGNYAYELWASGGGTGCMTVYGAQANFGATWNNVEDFLARIGLGFDQTKTPAQIGTLSADFAETKTGDTGLVYVGIYGWTVNPLREFYILDDWGSTKPAGVASDGTPRDSVGTISVDGAVYDVWKKTRTNKPAITGDNKTFDQYFSIRQTARQCGHISISEHFSKWMGLGLQLGNLEEAKLLLEAQGSTGTVEFTTATVVVK